MFQIRSFLSFTVAGLALLSGTSMASELPTGGQIVAGSGNISQSGTTLTVTQDSASLATNWQSFSIGQGHTVNFHQPSANAVALNRVLGSDVSVIQGSLNANGKVFLINPNGVTFSPDAQVNVGGLVASTLDMKTEDFLAGNYNFEGQSSNAVINQGSIRTPQGGMVALIGAKIINRGSIITHGGDTLMGAGEKVTLDLGGPVKLEVLKGAIDTLIEQGGVVRADGGQIYLTAKAAGTLATSVINHTGVTEAKTLVTGQKGEIILLGDMAVGTTNVSGTLDATAPLGGDGGFIETSAAHVNIAEATTITAGSAYGKGGTWLIDPYDYNIDAAAAGNIAGALNTGTNVTVTTTADIANYGSGGFTNVNGDIRVNSAIAKTAGGDATLSLIAANNIVIDAPITSTSNKLNLLLDADNDSGTRNGGGVTIANTGVSLNGGNLDFGTGATVNLNGVNTLVGGDLYIGGNAPVVFSTGGGATNLHGQLIIANNGGGVKFITGGGDANFFSTINSGNRYEKVAAAPGNYFTWNQAFADAKNGTVGGSAIGDSYLATVTSRLENALVVYAGNFPIPTGDNIVDLSNGAWIGGKRTNDAGVWYWLSGPEGEMNGGQGLAFSDSSLGGASVGGEFIAWRGGEPNGGAGPGGEDHLQIGDAQGGWNDLANDDVNVHMLNFIRETNLASSDFEIDAGTGTVNIVGAIGGQKPINFIKYDASNPRPVTTPVVQLPQQTAIASAQNTSTTLPSERSEPYTAPLSFGEKESSLTAGTMEIIQISEADAKDMEEKEEQDSESRDNAEAAAPTKVFVVDGGVRLPTNTK